jgi:outer membrane protein
MSAHRFEGFQLNDAEHDRAEALRRAALSTLLPKAALQGLYVHNSYETASLPKDNVSGSASLNLSLFNGPAFPAWSAAKSIEQSTNAQLDRQRNILFYDVVQAFYTALTADRQVSVREQALRGAEESLRVARERQTAGLALPAAVARASLEEARARAALEQARLTQAQARAALGFLIGQDPPEALAAPSAPVVPDGDEARWLELARSGRSDLEAAALATSAARAIAEQAWMDYLPTLTFTAALRASPTGFIGTGGTSGGLGGSSAPDPVTWQVGLRMDFTLYDGGAREAATQLKRINLREAQLGRQQLERQIGLEVRQARLQLAAVEAQLTAYQEQVRAARENFAVIDAQQRAGRATPLEVADATTARADAEVQQLLGELARDLARLTLRRALGLPPLER